MSTNDKYHIIRVAPHVGATSRKIIKVLIPFTHSKGFDIKEK